MLKAVGDAVIGSTINNHGTLVIQITKLPSETLLAKIIALVENAQNNKTGLQKTVDRLSSAFIPFVIIIALLSAFIRLVVGPSTLGDAEALKLALMSFIGVLVIACPCGLGLATPMAVMAGLGKGAEHGVLFKHTDALQKLAKTKAIIFDKTGTITEGKPRLHLEESLSKKDIQSLEILYSLEKLSSHPLAYAVVRYAEENKMTLHEVEDFQTVVGKGVQGNIDGQTYYVGNQ